MLNQMIQKNTGKAEAYKWVKIGGILSFLPFVIAAGPVAGYIVGDYLVRKFGLPFYTLLILITLGIAGSIRETIRIIKFALKTEEGS